jgi:phosphatidate cytidylyltransferase
MAGKASNLALRFATAAVGIPVILALIFKAPAWGFYLLVLPAALIGVWELFTMTHERDTLSKSLGVLLAAGASVAVFFFSKDPRVVMTVLVAVPLAGLLLSLVRIGEMKTAALRACALGFGPLMVTVPLTLLAVMRKEVEGGAGFVLYALGFAWMSDTGGYFAGRFLGKHKLYEAVSPKKTIEGSIGGLAASAAWGVAGHFTFASSVPLLHAAVLGLVAGGLGQAGDLGESLLKRSTGVKDSGQIVPGHGGILDRVDALILTSTAVYLYTVWFSR